ncbi:hypothetical protein AOA80_09685 [Methanomassiliicoccales archaeon RumEn M1]|jgi:hypothetical protein|nr:hypothetical protein AOA80_09685 [Methanomassiliicoccales archaeon RumEn M1]
MSIPFPEAMSEEKERSPMPGGFTRTEFESLREDLQELLSAHPGARFTIILTDEEGKVTDDVSRAKRYGLTVHEGDVLLHEEFGDVDWPSDG